MPPPDILDLTKFDTGMLTSVPKKDRLDVDEGEGVNALEGGADDDDLDAIYADPGEVVEEDLG